MPGRKKRLHAVYADLMLAPAVIAMRLPLLALETISGATEGSEGLRSINEKALASAEGLAAAQVALIRSSLRFWPEVLSGRSPSLLNGTAMRDCLTVALRPTSQRVARNFDRLSTTYIG